MVSKKIKFIDLFSGIGGIRKGFELIRTPDVVFSKLRKSPILRHFRA